MMILYLGSNEKKNSGQELNKIEARLAERKQKMNGLKIKCQNVKRKLNNMEQYKWNIEKQIFGKLMSLTF